MEAVIPTKDEVYAKVDQAINQLIHKDGYLLEIDANERAISHRLGLYLQLLFEDWDVDCEYNRDLDRPKRIKTYKGFLKVNQRKREIAETDPITVFPDIIIHKRGTHENLLIIEMKKSTSKIDSELDYFKLKEFKYHYQYKHALFLKINSGTDAIGKYDKEYLPDSPEAFRLAETESKTTW